MRIYLKIIQLFKCEIWGFFKLGSALAQWEGQVGSFGVLGCGGGSRPRSRGVVRARICFGVMEGQVGSFGISG